MLWVSREAFSCVDSALTMEWLWSTLHNHLSGILATLLHF